ncbi:MAG: RbsD/FucU family protein [Anaerolineae bacterium]|nr:RbsD/FucU family protein [Anaerolineae bacterium]
MLKSKLLHPEILSVLGASGHGGKILIADGNYPFNTRANPAARRVYLNLMPGRLTVTDVLEALLTAIPVEAAEVMLKDSGQEPEIYADFRRLLPDLTLQAAERFAFYEKCFDRDVCLVIATGEQRLFANILLTIGVVSP